MDINEVLQFIDEAMSAKNGKHLNDLQRKIIEGVLNRQKYADIADDYERSQGHVKDVGYELLQMLSDIFDETVTKGNLKSVLERQGNFKLYLIDNIVQSNRNNNNIGDRIIGSINMGSDDPKSTSDKSQIQNVTPIQNQEIARIKKLRKCGLSDEEIADVLDIPLEAVKNIETVEFDEI